jgi:hypothetical protein
MIGLNLKKNCQIRKDRKELFMYTEQEFISLATNEIKLIGEQTGKYFYIKKVNKDEDRYDIFYGKQHIMRSNSFEYLVGYLHGMRNAWE